MIITASTKVECKKCRFEFEIEADDFADPETYSNERNMGYETQYIWNYEGLCEKCENEISITIEGWEYPEGVFNYEEFTSSGCRIIQNPTLEINYKEDRDDVEMD